MASEDRNKNQSQMHVLNWFKPKEPKFSQSTTETRLQTGAGSVQTGLSFMQTGLSFVGFSVGSLCGSNSLQVAGT